MNYLKNASISIGNNKVITAILIASISAPFLSFFAHNYSDPSFRRDLFVFFSICSVIFLHTIFIIVALTLSKLIKINFTHILITICTVWLFLFFFAPIHESISSILRDLGILRGATIVFVSLSLITGWGTHKLARFHEFRITLMSVYLTMALFSCVQVGLNVANEFGYEHTAGWQPKNIDENKGVRSNIYFIVPDAYGSQETLKKVVGLDVSVFVDNMKALGFKAASKAKSPYTITYATFTSILNADYILDETGHTEQKPKIYYPRLLNQGTLPAAIHLLKELGYEKYAILNSGIYCWGGADCPTDVGFAKIPYEVYAFLESTPLAPLLQRIAPLEVRTAIGKALDLVQHPTALKAPRFMLIHNLAPHPPFDLNPDCSRKKNIKFDMESWNVEAIPHYADNVLCTNDQLLELSKTILQKDSEAIIIVIGDHGTAFTVNWDIPLDKWTKSQISERSGVITFYHFPDACDFRPSQEVNSINLMRLALACVSGTPPELLPNRTFISAYDNMEQVHLVHESREIIPERDRPQFKSGMSKSDESQLPKH